jgi:hypothetical protein
MEDSPMDAAVAGLIGACVGAVAGLGGSIAAAIISRRSEERRHYRELGIQVALAKFNQQAALLNQLANATGKVEFMPPFETFLVYGIRLMEIVADLHLSPEEIKSKVDALVNSLPKQPPVS